MSCYIYQHQQEIHKAVDASPDVECFRRNFFPLTSASTFHYLF